jgi:hypothetical protein
MISGRISEQLPTVSICSTWLGLLGGLKPLETSFEITEINIKTTYIIKRVLNPLCDITVAIR